MVSSFSRFIGFFRILGFQLSALIVSFFSASSARLAPATVTSAQSAHSRPILSACQFVISETSGVLFSGNTKQLDNLSKVLKKSEQL